MSVLSRILSLPPVARLPVRVRSGVAAGARWSLFPYSAYWRGTHEPHLQQRIINLLDWTGKTAWDLGSHYGLFAIGLARRVGPAGHVAAFEPNPTSYERLSLHARRNALPQLHLFASAVSETTGSATFILDSSRETTTSHLPYEQEGVTASTPTVSVPTVRLDDLVADGRIKAPHFIKLDVEGHGHRAMRGAIHTIRTHRPIIISGIHSPQESAGLLELLIPLGYSVECLTPNCAAIPSHEGDYLWRPL